MRTGGTLTVAQGLATAWNEGFADFFAVMVGQSFAATETVDAAGDQLPPMGVGGTTYDLTSLVGADGPIIDTNDTYDLQNYSFTDPVDTLSKGASSDSLRGAYPVCPPDRRIPADPGNCVPGPWRAESNVQPLRGSDPR